MPSMTDLSAISGLNFKIIQNLFPPFLPSFSLLFPFPFIVLEDTPRRFNIAIECLNHGDLRCCLERWHVYTDVGWLFKA